MIMYNQGNSSSMIYLSQNSVINVTNTNFTENFNLKKGAVLYGDYRFAKANIIGCNFTRNYADQGGVFYFVYNSQLYCQYCLFEGNFARKAGVGMATDNA